MVWCGGIFSSTVKQHQLDLKTVHMLNIMPKNPVFARLSLGLPAPLVVKCILMCLKVKKISIAYNRHCVHLPRFHSRERLHARLAHDFLPPFLASAADTAALGRSALALRLPSVMLKHTLVIKFAKSLQWRWCNLNLESLYNKVWISTGDSHKYNEIKKSTRSEIEIPTSSIGMENFILDSKFKFSCFSGGVKCVF